MKVLRNNTIHDVSSRDEVQDGDILFLVNCWNDSAMFVEIDICIGPPRPPRKRAYKLPEDLLACIPATVQDELKKSCDYEPCM